MKAQTLLTKAAAGLGTVALALAVSACSHNTATTSDYGNVRNFINKSLAAVPALGLDKLHVERKNVGDTLVSADVGFVIYLRGA